MTNVYGAQGGRDSYDVALICLNGHSINSGIQDAPQFSSEHCSKCGAGTIHSCPSCNEDIRGSYRGFAFPYNVPSFCHKCGAPYPWTEARMDSARELADMVDTAAEAEKIAFKDSLPDLISDTPRTQIAVTRATIFIKKAGKEIGGGLRQLLVEIASETVVKLIKGN